MKKFLISLLMFMIPSLSMANTVDMKDPYKMMTTVSEITFKKIKENSSKLSDAQFRRQLIEENLIPYTDLKYVSYMVLGTELKKASATQRDEFVKAFSNYIITTYADTLGKYDKQTIVPPKYQKVDDKATRISMDFIIKEEGKKDLVATFKLFKNKKTQEWKVYDMVAEGVSLLKAKQSELSPIIKQKGIDEVIKLLKEKK